MSVIDGATVSTGTGFGVKMSEIDGEIVGADTFVSVVVVYGIAADGELFDMLVVAYGIAAVVDVLVILDISATLTKSAPRPRRTKPLGALRGRELLFR